MSRFDAFTKGWSFRTNRPAFERGEEITAFVTGRDNGGHVVRIGDTVLSIDDAENVESAGNGDGDSNRSSDGNGSGDEADLLDIQVRLRVEEFSTNDYTGRATVLERLGEGSF
jgi:hypothetical protein